METINHLTHVMDKNLEAKVWLLDGDQVDHYWPEIERCLLKEPELWNRQFTVESLYKRAKEDYIQVWVIAPSAKTPITTVFFTTVVTSDVGRALHIFWIWGTDALRALYCASLAVDRFAEHHGCNEIVVTGRKGWERALRGLGGKFESITMSRPVQKQKRGH